LNSLPRSSRINTGFTMKIKTVIILIAVSLIAGAV
jgi:hypothetical protein